MNNFSGNGYQERQSVIQRNLNSRLNYIKSQADALNKEEKTKQDNNLSNTQENIKAMNNLSNNPLPQNHLKFPGNNQFKH